MTPAAENDFWEGYRDGRDGDCPEPSANRSACYRHSFEVGRAELANKPILACLSRERADLAIKKRRKPMTNIELSAILDRVGNPTGEGLAALHNTGRNLPNRWLNGKSRIPEPVAVWWRALDAWVDANPAPRGW